MPSVNLGRAQAAMERAADLGAQLAVFPEGTLVRFSADLRAAAEPVDGQFGTGLQEAARKHQLAVVAGTFEPAPGDRIYNTALAIDADGALAACYRKLHLFDALGQKESELVTPGDEPVVTTLAGLRVGIMTCYDVRFPELARALTLGGSDVIVLPAAWAAGLFKEEHWTTLARARAIENTVWIAAACQVPDPAEPATMAPTGIGRSMLIDPMGTARLDLGPAECVAAGDIDTEVTERVRRVLPVLSHRRADVFGPVG